MKEIIAMHGWASDSSVWMPWKNYFQEKGWLWQNIDRGYGAIREKEAKWTHVNQYQINYKRAIICHSLGFHLINPEILKKATDIVLISGFGRFITEGPGNRSLRTALQGMQKALEGQGETKMLIKFLEKAFKPYKFNLHQSILAQKELSMESRRKLQSDLDLLIKTEGVPHELPINSRLLTIFGEKDSILQPSSISSLLLELKNYLHNEPNHWRSPNEGHFLFSLDVIKHVDLWLEAAE